MSLSRVQSQSTLPMRKAGVCACCAPAGRALLPKQPVGSPSLSSKPAVTPGKAPGSADGAGAGWFVPAAAAAIR
jgi:hypothetical protein